MGGFGSQVSGEVLVVVVKRSRVSTIDACMASMRKSYIEITSRLSWNQWEALFLILVLLGRLESREPSAWRGEKVYGGRRK